MNFSFLTPFLTPGPAGGLHELYLEESFRRTLRWEEGRLDEVAQGETAGVGFRRLSKGRTEYAAMDARRPVTEGLSERERASLSRLWPPTGGRKKTNPPSLPPLVERRHPVQRPAEAWTLRDKAHRLAAAEKAARSAGALRQVTVTWGESVKSTVVLNNQGTAVREDRSYVTFVVQATAEKDGLRQTGYEVCAGVGGTEIFDQPGLETLARLAARRARAKLSAPPAPLGETTVVISSQAGGTLIHEAIGHALEADSVQDGSSPAFAGKIGRRIANEKISVLDDPTRPGHRGSFYFDDEGTPAEKTVLVENGILKTYLYDRRSAERDRRVSNGHGRRESFRHKPIPRMSNTFVAPGREDPKKILRDLRRGLFVTRMGGGQVNTTTGDFVFEVEEGFWVEDGRLRHPVRGANLLGNASDVLRGIDRVGWDLGWSVGTCGKEGQGAPVSDGVPTLRIPKILIGGTEG